MDTRNGYVKEQLMLVEHQIEHFEKMNQRLMDSSNLGRRFKDRTFDNFKAEYQPEAFSKAYEYAKGFESNDGAGLILIGSAGTGKTHLAASITNFVIAEYAVAAKFGSFIDILSDIKKSFTTDDDIVRKLKGIPLLVIDDLGKERSSEWSESILYDVINGRYEDYMPTIITTNLNPQQIEARCGEAIVSRLFEMCDAVPMNGTDMRMEQRK